MPSWPSPLSCPDLVLVIGGLTEIGAEEEYRALRAQLDRVPMPAYLIPGNQDWRDELRAAFTEQPWMHQHEYVHAGRRRGRAGLHPGARHGGARPCP
jgi:3',5'-cyclic AMP phosphodiesterase CpdA